MYMTFTLIVMVYRSSKTWLELLCHSYFFCLYCLWEHSFSSALMSSIHHRINNRQGMQFLDVSFCFLPSYGMCLLWWYCCCLYLLCTVFSIFTHTISTTILATTANHFLRFRRRCVFLVMTTIIITTVTITHGWVPFRRTSLLSLALLLAVRRPSRPSAVVSALQGTCTAVALDRPFLRGNNSAARTVLLVVHCFSVVFLGSPTITVPLRFAIYAIHPTAFVLLHIVTLFYRKFLVSYFSV